MSKDEKGGVTALPANQMRVDVSAFLRWDDFSQTLAATGQFDPPWFRATGLDEGEILLWPPSKVQASARAQAKPLRKVSDNGGSDPVELEKCPEPWEAPGALVAKVRGPTRAMVEALLDEGDPKRRAAASRELVQHCLLELPDGMTARVPFKVKGHELVAAGERIPAPWQLVDQKMPEGVTEEEALRAYVDSYLPNKLRGMVHTAAIILAVPEVEFVTQQGKEKGFNEAPATMAPGKKAANDPNSIEP